MDPARPSPRFAAASPFWYVLAVAASAWESLDWEPGDPVAPLPLAHYPQLESAPVDLETKRALGRLFSCFTCELFIHFEGYVIDYLARFPERAGDVPRVALLRFTHEEEVHRDAFRRLLPRLRPDLYAAESPRFLLPTRGERWVLARLSGVSFFLLAMLFEEITLFVPEVIARAESEPCSALLRQVMDLHARDERGHVGLDERVLRRAGRAQGRARTLWQVLLTLPALWYLDRQIARAFRSMVAHAERELDLEPAARRHLAKRCPTESDRLGVLSFAAKLPGLGLPGARLLGRTLRRALA